MIKGVIALRVLNQLIRVSHNIGIIAWGTHLLRKYHSEIPNYSEGIIRGQVKNMIQTLKNA